ncbi:molybdopterin-guanine dinucleotide biosynthesis protein MobB [Serratia sp. DD3]|uniref:molybdopterin-guanine dinucleotide biosynthesis protein MobB n=1 Tax=Serratia sp. DD3 TaxID=1410619 RepID=UPI0004D71989|nr:molybdopterin-guanine dinucleotide biosynthesis protein MobB [Serratia sp. DD3]KEY59803.1 molybdopterin-guanine dinucleotide biosynthesis adapter protein [Serratia sp. DD3]
MGTLPPLLAIAAYSGTGKTTLLKQLIPLLGQQQIRVGLIKHTHHDMDVDTPGKDSYELRKAGAAQTLVASDRRWALMTEMPEGQSLDLNYLAGRFDSNKVDLILVEGFKHEQLSKIILYREAVGKPLSDMLDKYVIAVASDTRIEGIAPWLDINQPAMIALFIAQWLESEKR